MTRWNPCDALLVTAFLYPETVLRSKFSNVEIELDHGSPNRRGLMIEAHSPESGSRHHILELVDEESFKNLIVQSVSN